MPTALIARAQHIFSAADDAPERPHPWPKSSRSVAGFSPDMTWRVATWPERAARLQARLERYEAALNAAGLDARHLAPRSYAWRRAATYALKSVLFFDAGLPAALIGGLVHYPAYRVVGWVRDRNDERAQRIPSRRSNCFSAMLLFR